MDKMKKLSIIWGVIVIVLIIFLTSVGFIYKNKSQKYKDLEKELVEIVKTYTSSNFNFPVNEENNIITVDELRENGLIDKFEVEKQKCDGYVQVSFDNVTKYKAYINCDKYKTHGFEKQYLNNK